LPAANGLLYVTLDSGEMVFWEMPGQYGARPISGDGRWVVWSAQGGDGGSYLLDTVSGRDRVLSLAGEAAGAAGFSDDGATMVLVSGSAVALVETDSSRVLARAPAPKAGQNGAAEFSVDGAAALGFSDASGAPAATMILRPDGSTSTIAGGTWAVRWSPDGALLAVTTATGSRIISAEGATKLEIPFGEVEHGYNPRWSPDGKYIAIANSYAVGGARVFDAITGDEVLRTTGSPTCLADYWLADGSLSYGWQGNQVAVPSGEKSQSPPPARKPDFTFDQSARMGVTRLLLDSGRSVEFRSEAPWSAYYDGEGVRLTMSDGRALFLIGIGGKGLCDGQMAEPSVQLPPFN
jgi:WD40 repeat protein